MGLRMKRVLVVLGLGLVVLVLVLVGRAFAHAPQARGGPASVPADGLDANRIAQHLGEAIRFPTVSHQEAKDDDAAAFDGLHAWLAATYPKTHAALAHETLNGHGLLFRWEGSDPTLEPILVMAHQDVVPVEPGTEAKWSHPPFGGELADGFVWGRGALDDKGSLVCLFEALESLVAEGVKPTRTLWLASGFDEEVGGARGAKSIAQELAKRGLRFAWVLDEGSAVTKGIVPGVERPVAVISVSEKGYVTLELVAKTQGGHSSMPPKQTAIGVLAAAIERLEQHPFPSRVTPVLRENLETLAPEQGFGGRLVLSNLWLFEGLVARTLSGRPETAALVRTTTAPTMLEAGVKENVLPSSAKAVVNFRVLGGDTVDGVVEHVKALVNDERVTVTKLERTISEPAPFSSSTGPGYALLAKATRAAFPDAVVVPSTVNGATDSRHFQAIAKDTYRFVPSLLDKTDLPRIHGTDERAGVEDLVRAVRVYRQILREGTGAPEGTAR